MNFHQPLLALAMVALGSLLALMCFGQVYSEELKIYKRNIGPRVPFTQFPFAALIVATGSDNTIEYLCSGSILDATPQLPSHILTSANCLQERNDASGKPVRWWVMIENPQGNITMSTSTFSRFAVEKKFLHPDAAKISEFSFTSKYPNGTVADFAVAISPNDVGILRLTDSLANIQGVQPINLSKNVPQVNDAVSFVGYGGPQFFTLGATTGMVVLPSTDGSGSGNSSQTNKKVVFIQDTRSNILPNETMSVEPGDEGSAMLDVQKQQVGIVIGSWRVNPSSTEEITFATIGPAIEPNLDFINSIMNEQKVYPSEATAKHLHATFCALVSVTVTIVLAF